MPSIVDFINRHGLNGFVSGRPYIDDPRIFRLDFIIKDGEGLERVKSYRQIAPAFQELMQTIILPASPAEALKEIKEARESQSRRGDEAEHGKNDLGQILYISTYASKRHISTVQDLISSLVITEQDTTSAAGKRNEATGFLDSLIRLIPALSSYVEKQRLSAPDIRADGTTQYNKPDGTTSPNA